MRFFTGVACKEAVLLGQSHNVALMVQPDTYGPGTVAKYPAFAIDNGCFSEHNPTSKRPWTRDRWLRRTDRLPRDGCVFAVVPDVLLWTDAGPVGDAQATLDRFEREHATVRAMGFPVAFVLQNGQEHLPVPWDLADAVFIGGDTGWKLSHHALYLANEAKDHGLHVHMGRANSLKRLRRAQEMRVDSADGNFLKWPTTNAPRLRAFLDNLPTEVQLACA